LRVINEAEQGLVGGGGGHQAQHRQSDQETVGRGSDTAAKGYVQRLALRLRQLIEAIHQWRTQLLQAGEWELHVRLHARHLDTAKLGRQLRHKGQQDGFSDASFSAKNQNLVVT
jgi:hydroxymethylglutaryl-CoA reductase